MFARKSKIVSKISLLSRSFAMNRQKGRSLDNKMKRNHSIPGLGAAMINSHYDIIGSTVKTPFFLKQPKTTSVIGAPLSYGQPLPGTDKGPELLRQNGLISCLESLEWQVNEMGDLAFDPPSENDPRSDIPTLKNTFCVGKGLEKIYYQTKSSLDAGEFSLILGGDHSIGLATLAAVLAHRPETGIVWVDAHGDLNTPEESKSGNIHGMPLSFLFGLVTKDTDQFAKSYPGFEWFKKANVSLSPEQFVYVGLRDLDPFERTMIRKLGIKTFTMQHVDRLGIGAVMDSTLRFLDGRPLHLSYDIDAVDPEHAPSTGTVVRGGLNFREAHYIAEAMGDSGRLGSMDLVEVNPTLKPGKEADLTCHLGMALIASAMGSRIL